MQSSMHRRCGQLPVAQIKGEFVSAEKCPEGRPSGTSVSEFIDTCIHCPRWSKGTTMKQKKPVKGKRQIGKQVEGGVIYKKDAIDLLRALPDESIDLAIFDPAYESLEKHRGTGTTTRLKNSKGSSNKWFTTFPNSRYPELFQELFRVMKKGTHIYMFCDEETRDIVTVGFSAQYPDISLVSEGYSGPNSPLLGAGFKYWKAVVWDKKIPGMGYHYRAQHEFILMAERVETKGKHRKLNDLACGDVLSVKRLKGKGYYPTEKPMPLIWKLITQSSNEHDNVLDFFCGSGSVGAVAKLTNRYFILGDIDPSEAIKRLS
jgi:site-specific DNA-methyltransferase (adenine-specific)